MSRLATRSASSTNTYTTVELLCTRNRTEPNGACSFAPVATSFPKRKGDARPLFLMKLMKQLYVSLSLCAAYSTQQQKVLTTILIDASTYKYTIIYTHRHSVRIYLYQETAHKRFSFKTMNRIDDLMMR